MQLIYVNPLSSAVTATPVDTPRPFTESCMRAVKILLRLILQLTFSWFCQRALFVFFKQYL